MSKESIIPRRDHNKEQMRNWLLAIGFLVVLAPVIFLIINEVWKRNVIFFDETPRILDNKLVLKFRSSLNNTLVIKIEKSKSTESSSGSEIISAVETVRSIRDCHNGDYLLELEVANEENIVDMLIGVIPPGYESRTLFSYKEELIDIKKIKYEWSVADNIPNRLEKNIWIRIGGIKFGTLMKIEYDIYVRSE